MSDEPNDSLDLSRLEKLRQQAGGKLIARCPACAEEGGDRKGNHLAVFPDGRFACAARAGDEIHRREIFGLVGLRQPRPPQLASHSRRKNLSRTSRRAEGRPTEPTREKTRAHCRKLIERWRWAPEDIWDDSPTRPKPAVDDPRIFLAALFPPEARLWTGAVHHSGPGHEDRWRTMEEWFDSPVQELGPMTCPATWRSETTHRRADSVEASPYVVLDFDGPKGWKPTDSEDVVRHIAGSIAIVRWLRECRSWELAALVQTGSKSIHAWFRQPDPDTIESLRKHTEDLGIDAGLIGHPEHPCRLPGQRHEKTGRLSRTLWLQ